MIKKDPTLYDYQQRYKEIIYDYWEKGHSVMLQMPTGTGKTRLFVSLIRDILENDLHARVLILAHRDELIEQIIKENAKYGLECGRIQSGHFENNSRVMVASIQTLAKRLRNYDDSLFQYLIIDEAHHAVAQTYKRTIQKYTNAKLLGVTATPYRLNGDGFTFLFDRLLVSEPILSFIHKGYLANYDYISVSPHSNIQRLVSNLPIARTGDYSVYTMNKTFDVYSIRTDLVKMYLKYAYGKKGIVYTISRSHNYNVCNRFVENGIKAKYIDSETSADKRKEIVEQFREGYIDVLCNVDIFSEGFDCPDVEFIMLARPTCSLSLYLQQIGRGLRVNPKNKEAKVAILDAVGLYNKFGLPSKKREWIKYFIGDSENTVNDQEEIIKDASENYYAWDEDNIIEGDESATLIETTKEDIKDFVSSERENKWELIEKAFDEIREIIPDVCLDVFVNNPIVKESQITYIYEIKEDIFCPVTSLSCGNWDEKDPLFKDRMKYDMKAQYNEKERRIEYVLYEDENDYFQCKARPLFSLFKIRLSERIKPIIERIGKIDLIDFVSFCVDKYGSEHVLTKKIIDVYHKADVRNMKFKEVFYSFENTFMDSYFGKEEE